jgi:hypothetical protein
MGYKWCPRCKRNRYITEFPVDRTRRNGRWHSCRKCNQTYCATRGKALAAQRKAQERSQRQTRQGLSGLTQCSHPGVRFANVPKESRGDAERIFSNSLARAEAQGRHLSQPQIASRIACAASNARRVGDGSWARRMRRLKGYRRAERRKMDQEMQLAEQREMQAANKAPRVNWSLVAGLSNGAP